MSERDRNDEGMAGSVEDLMIWQIWISEPLNKDAEVLVKWSRTSFFGGSPVSRPKVFEGREYAMYRKCSEEETMKKALATALSNYGQVRLTKHGEEVSLEPYLKDLPRPSGTLLGDAESMGRSGGMC
jgi:hypothetical protein